MGDEVVTGYFKSFDRALSGREDRDRGSGSRRRHYSRRRYSRRRCGY